MSVAPTKRTLGIGLNRAVSNLNPSLAILFSAMPPNPTIAYRTVFI
jgi:hypothetical protein